MSSIAPTPSPSSLARSLWECLHVLLLASAVVFAGAGLAAVLLLSANPLIALAVGTLLLWPAFCALVRTSVSLVMRGHATVGFWWAQWCLWPRDVITGAPTVLTAMLLAWAWGFAASCPGVAGLAPLGSGLVIAVLVLVWQFAMAATDHGQDRWSVVARHAVRVAISASPGVAAALILIVAGVAASVLITPTLLLLAPAPAALVLAISVWAGTRSLSSRTIEGRV